MQKEPAPQAKKSKKKENLENCRSKVCSASQSLFAREKSVGKVRKTLDFLRVTG